MNASQVVLCAKREDRATSDEHDAIMSAIDGTRGPFVAGGVKKIRIK